MKTNPAPPRAFGGMEFFPVAAREARVAARKIFSYDFRSLLAGVFVAVAFRRIFAPVPGGPTGPPLLDTLGLMAFLYATIAGAFKTFDSLAREKREGTLGLLLLTDLKPFQILFGKLLSSSALTVFGLLAFLPILSLPLILGGVTFDQFVRLAFSLVTALFLSMSWGLYISAAARNYVAALTGAAILVAVFAFAPLRLATSLNASLTTFPLDLATCLFSPTLPFVLAFTVDPDLVQFFWPAVACNLILTAGWISTAVMILPSRCHDAPGKNKWLEIISRRLHEFRFGNPQERARIRKRLLRTNPLFWLASRERIGSLGLIATCVIALLAGEFFKVPQLGLFLASIAILFRMAHVSAHSISEDQKNGALELLLSTSLPAEEIVYGLNRAMLRRFIAPVALVLIWPWFFIVPKADALFTTLLVCSSMLLLATWVTLSWVGPWFALRKSPTAATWTALSVVALPPWLIWCVSIFPGLFDPQFTDIHSIGAVVCSIVGVFHCVLVTRWARDILRNNFREAAADPFATIQFEPLLKALITEADLTVVPIGEGNVRVSRFGTSARVVAIPKAGHVFVGWGGHQHGMENPLCIELQGRAHIIARFAIDRLSGKA